MTLNITGVKVPLEDALDISDALAANGYPGGLRVCPGGRGTPEGYICIHCGKDPSAGDKCGEPRPLALQKMREAIAQGEQVLIPPMLFEG